MSSSHVRRLWRDRSVPMPGPRRGPSRQLDLDDILRAGIAIADAGGLEAVSTRSVAARFGVSAMALYPYAGTKENLLALMQDVAVGAPVLPDAPDLRDWAFALFEVYLAHPWLARRPWSQASQGPNEQDWLERLLEILAGSSVAPALRAPAVTMLYATVRATAETAAEYRNLDGSEWRARAAAIAELVPDLADRYPLSTSLPPVAADWRHAPRAGLAAAVDLLAGALLGAR